MWLGVITDSVWPWVPFIDRVPRPRPRARPMIDRFINAINLVLTVTVLT